MFVVRIPLFIALVVGTSFIAKAVDYILPTGVTVLTEEQLLTIIIGNTTTGKNSVAGKWAEYYEPSRDEGKNGEIRGKARRAYYGQWKINGSLMCLDFDGINSDMVQ